MSAILAVCGDAFCAMVSDGRYVEEPITGDKPHIISDELPKVRKVNRNVLVGFAGDTLAAVQIINALDQYDVCYLTLEKVVKILCEKAPAVTTQPVGVRLLVVLGHQNCGAIKQGVKEYENLLHEMTADAEDSLMAADSITDLDERIVEAESIMLRTVGFSIWQAHESELESNEDFERVHIARTIEELVDRSDVIRQALAEDRLMLVGARYQLDSGKVEVLSF